MYIFYIIIRGDQQYIEKNMHELTERKGRRTLRYSLVSSALRCWYSALLCLYLFFKFDTCSTSITTKKLVDGAGSHRKFSNRVCYVSDMAKLYLFVVQTWASLRRGDTCSSSLVSFRFCCCNVARFSMSFSLSTLCGCHRQGGQLQWSCDCCSEKTAASTYALLVPVIIIEFFFV